jgi:acetolactate synthase-1/3 small subunit
VANLVKQLAKLVKVRYVEDVTKVNRVERELVLLKLRAPPGPARTEVLQLAQIFRARVVDVGDACLTLCVSGDSGKVLAIQKVMAKFGIEEIARTGRVCLKRGDETLEPSWGAEGRARRAAVSNGTSPSMPPSLRTHDADVYVVDDAEAPGVWEVDNILEATYQADPSQCFSAYTLSIEVQDVPGVLNQVTQVFARRGYNVQSLAVGPSEREGMSRITTVLPGTGLGVSNLVKQLKKLVAVESVTDMTEKPFVSRELLLVKVRCNASQRGELRDLVEVFRGAIIDVSPSTMTIELTGKEDKMKAMTDLLEPYGIVEVARTGRVALLRESGVDVKYLESRSIQRVW